MCPLAMRAIAASSIDSSFPIITFEILLVIFLMYSYSNLPPLNYLKIKNIYFPNYNMQFEDEIE